jgi:hypothetical protein
MPDFFSVSCKLADALCLAFRRVFRIVPRRDLISCGSMAVYIPPLHPARPPSYFDQPHDLGATVLCFSWWVSRTAEANWARPAPRTVLLATLLGA